MRSITRGHLAASFSALAIIYGVVLLAVIAAVPAFDGETLLQYGGAWTVAIFVQPLVVSALMWWLLRARCHGAGRAASVAAWTIALAYLVYSVVGGFSIAAGALPAAMLLCCAVALTPRGTGER